MANLLTLLASMAKKKRTWALAALAAWGVSALQGKGGIESLWAEPREVLVDRVEEARDVQQETIEQFQTAMQKFKAVTGFQGGKLEEQYEVLNAAYERSEAAAKGIGEHIDQVTNAANALLEEWRGELKDYHDPKLRRLAEQQFDATRAQAGKMIAAMRRVEARSKPVLDLFRDQVLYLKHNLNAMAINSLDKERVKVEDDVNKLIAEMRAAIAEANQFIDTLSKG